MQVAEVKALEPLAEVVELTPQARYVIVLPDNVTQQSVEALRNAILKQGVENIIVAGVGDVHIYEIRSDS